MVRLVLSPFFVLRDKMRLMSIDAGLYGFDVRGPGFFRLHYWGDLLKILRGQIGAEVFVTAVPGCVSLAFSSCLDTE
jgi:hypothetical protein